MALFYAFSWNDIGKAFSIIELCFAGYCFYRLVKPFMLNKRTAVITSLIYSLAMIWLYVIPIQTNTLLAFAMGSLAAFCAMWFLERGNAPLKIFLSITYFSLRWFIVSGLVGVLYDELYRIIENTQWFKHSTSLGQFGVYIGISIFYQIIVLVIMLLSIYVIIKNFAYKYEQMSVGEMLILSFPPLFAALGYQIIRYYHGFYMMESKLSKGYEWLLLCYCGAAVALMVMLIAIYQNIKATQAERTENQIYLTQMDSLRRHIGQVEELYQDIRSMKHDMANHVATLERLYAENETEEAKKYVQSLESAFIESAGEINTGNPVTDVILKEWKLEARKKGIQFDSDFYFPEGSAINAFDLSIILNNALQNAVENAKKDAEGHISIVSYRQGNAYMIEIENSFSGNLKMDAEGLLPITSKAAEESHGYGLKNIRKVAKKYYGDIDISVKDQEFHLSIMLMME